MSRTKQNLPSPKVILCGRESVGKSTLLNAMHSPGKQILTNTTTAAGFKSIPVENEDVSLNLNVWDTAGQEAYRSLIKIYFRNVDVAVIVFDLTSKMTFDAVQGWIEQVEMYSGDHPHKYIFVGNKADLDDNIQVPNKMVEALAVNYDAKYIPTSANEFINTEELKHLIARSWLELLTRDNKDEIQIITNSDRPIYVHGSHYDTVDLSYVQSDRKRREKCC